MGFTAKHEDAVCNPPERVEELVRRRERREPSGRTIFNPGDGAEEFDLARSPVLQPDNHKIVGWEILFERGEAALKNSCVAAAIQSFASRLRIYRKRKNLSLTALGRKAGLHRLYIYQLESRRRSPSLRTVRKLAVALELTVSELVGDAEPAERD